MKIVFNLFKAKYSIKIPQGVGTDGVKMAGIIFWAFIAAAVITFFVDIFIKGLNTFVASYYINRISVLIIFLPIAFLTVKYFARQILNFPKITTPVLVVMFYLLSGLYGLVRGNSASYVLADFVLLMFPVVFYILSEKYLKGLNIETFFLWLFQINLFLGILSIIHVFAYDPILLLSGLSISLIFPGLNKYYFKSSFIYVILAIIMIILYLFVGATNKTQLLIAVLPALYLAVIRLYKNTLSARFMLNALAVIVAIVTVVAFGVSKNYRSYQVMDLFVRSVSVDKLASVAKDPKNVFNIVHDVSSAHRIFEFIKVQQAVSNNIATTVFGMGLGGNVDMSDTKDGSVLGAYGVNINKVRVFHLMFSFMLAKFGIIGLVIMAVGTGWLCVHLYRNIVRFDLIQLLAVTYILSASIGMFATFSAWIKTPLLGVMFWVLVNRKRLIKNENIEYN